MSLDTINKEGIPCLGEKCTLVAGKVGGGGGGWRGGRGGGRGRVEESERPHTKCKPVVYSLALTTAADVNKFIAVQCNKVDLKTKRRVCLA